MYTEEEDVISLLSFVRPNQEQLRNMQLLALWQESNLRPCDSGALNLRHSKFGLGYVLIYVEQSHS